MAAEKNDRRRGSDLVLPKREPVDDDRSLDQKVLVGEDQTGVQLRTSGLVYLVCARQHDTFKVLRAYTNPYVARFFAMMGDELERDSKTAILIKRAREAETDDERDTWAMEIMSLETDGVRYWKHYVEPVTL